MDYMVMNIRKRGERNRTLTLSPAEKKKYKKNLLQLKKNTDLNSILNKTINQDLLEVIPFLPDQFVDLLIVDPPYNLHKCFNQKKFRKLTEQEYAQWMQEWLDPLRKVLKPTASIYVCSDWQTSPIVYEVLKKYFIIRNRITWEREKGRGSRRNWKNCSEDIWFCTVSKHYFFDVDAVKLKRRVIAPYTHNGTPKDWQRGANGNFRLTHPSNLWTDLCVPFWSMPENTDHPTQKPEKLLAKLILASSCEGDVILDPFLGSGTSSVVAKKLNRRYLGIELDQDYACMAEKRLHLAEQDTRIQGYHDGVFWERNSSPARKSG